MPRFKVVITDFDYGDNDIECSILEPIGAEVVALQAKSEDDLLVHMPDCDAVMNQYARVGRRAIAVMRRCKVIARYGIGVDIVDVDAATARGILVTNVRDYCTEEVADHAIALWLTLARKLSQYDRATHAGVWHWKSGQPVHRIRGQTMGVVSFGKIGQAIAARALGFGVHVVAYDPYLPEAFFDARDVERVTKEELLERAHVVMMQVPMTPETRHSLGPNEFTRMRPGAIVVNTGRGPTIDNKALYDALLSGRIGGAGLDDPEEEPAKRAHWKPEDNALFGLQNVIITPHSAYYSEESIQLARQTAAREVARVLTGQRPHNPVNDVQAAVMP
jgi:D-3-phosphoglycerate dehydrogenase